MATIPPSTTQVRPRPAPPRPIPRTTNRIDPAPRRIAWNFAFLSCAEILCRGTSVAVTLSLARRLGLMGYGRIEFAFNIVFWLVLIIRDAFEVIVSRELARHPRLIRPLVNHILAIKGTLALALFLGLVTVGSAALSTPTDRAILALYGLLLLTTSLGLDFVYRGTERMGLVAVSLCLRTLIYASGVWLCVADVTDLIRVPAWLVVGEVSGITLVWICYSRQYGLPRPVFGLRFLRVFLRRGRSVCLIQVAQTVIVSADLMVVGLLCSWSEVGRYGAPHRMVTAILTFGMLFQQAAFPTLARSWRKTATQGNEALNAMVKVLIMGLLPVAVGGAILAGPIVRLLLSKEYEGAEILLALGIWRVPLLTLAYLYQTMLIALNRESTGVRLLVAGAALSGPLVAISLRGFGLAGASAAVLFVGMFLLGSGYRRLAREGRQPAWHHHLGRPLLASLVMAPACLILERWGVATAVIGGAATYLVAIWALGGLCCDEVRAVFARPARPESPARLLAAEAR